MSKLLLVLCLIIGSYTANASVIGSAKEQLENIKEKIMEMVQGAIDRLEEAIESVKGGLANWAEKAKAKADEVTNQVRETIDKIRKKMQEKIDELLEKAEEQGIDVEECKKIPNQLRGIAAKIAADSKQCLTSRIEEGSAYIEDINRIAKEVYAELNEIGQEAAACFDKLEGIRDATEALFCLNTALGKATKAVMFQVPAAVNDMAHFGLSVAKTIPGMSFCASKAGVLTISAEMGAVKDQVQLCIDAKVEELGPSTTAY